MTGISREAVKEIMDAFVVAGDLPSDGLLTELSENSGIAVIRIKMIYTNIYHESTGRDDDPWEPVAPIIT